MKILFCLIILNLFWFSTLKADEAKIKLISKNDNGTYTIFVDYEVLKQNKHKEIDKFAQNFCQKKHKIKIKKRNYLYTYYVKGQWINAEEYRRAKAEGKIKKQAIPTSISGESRTYVCYDEQKNLEVSYKKLNTTETEKSYQEKITKGNKSTIKIPITVNIAKIDIQGDLVNYKTITTKEMVRKDINKTNIIWSQANIEWDLININFINTNLKNFKKNEKWIQKKCSSKFIDLKWIENNSCSEKPNLAKRRNNIYGKLLNTKKNNNNYSINIYYLPKMLDASCGRAWEQFRLVIISQTCLQSTELSGITLAHELGHILSLHHVEEKNFLMNTYHQPGGNKLSKKEINQARNFNLIF